MRVASPTQHYCPFDSLTLFAPSSTGVEPEYSLRRDLFPHHLSSHLLHEPLRPVRDRASHDTRPGLRKLVTSWVLKPGSHGTPPDDVGLDEGSSRREGTGLWGWLWGRGDFPLRRGVMFIHSPTACFVGPWRKGWGLPVRMGSYKQSE